VDEDEVFELFLIALLAMHGVPWVGLAWDGVHECADMIGVVLP